MDDIFGVNFVQGTTSGDPYDDNGHGTFVAGVVGAVGNNGIGISGVAQVASIIGAIRVQGPALTISYLPSSILSKMHTFILFRLQKGLCSHSSFSCSYAAEVCIIHFPRLLHLCVAVPACKFMDSSGNGWISDAIRCYDYCTNADAHIISNSWGVYDTSNALQVRTLVPNTLTFDRPALASCLQLCFLNQLFVYSHVGEGGNRGGR